MSWRIVVIDKRAKLSFKLGHMVVRMEENKVNRIYLKDISHVILNTTEVSITAALLNEFQKNKIRFITCDEKRNPSAELVPYYNSYITSEKIKCQIKWSEDMKGDIWQMIVKEKIKNQRDMLKQYEKPNWEMLDGYINEVQFFDNTNREGHAAKVYFNALFGMDFSRSDDSNINKELNYGYSIILSAINRSIVSQGYITQLGFFHDNMFNQFNLSCDLMEPIRVLVDSTVYNMKHDTFGNEEKFYLIDILNQSCKIDGKEQIINNAINIYTKSIFDSLNEKDFSLIRFPEYEL